MFKDAQLASLMTLTRRLITRCTLQPSQAHRLFSCSLGIQKHVQIEHLLAPPPRMLKDFIDLSILKDAQPGFFSQSVNEGLYSVVYYYLHVPCYWLLMSII